LFDLKREFRWIEQNNLEAVSSIDIKCRRREGDAMASASSSTVTMYTSNASDDTLSPYEAGRSVQIHQNI